MQDLFSVSDFIIANRYYEANNSLFSLKIVNLTIENGVKNWNTEFEKAKNLAIFGNDNNNLNNVIRGIAGYQDVASGEILINSKKVTFQAIGIDRSIAYFGELKKIDWNKLFSVRYNLAKSAKHNKNFVVALAKNNNKIKTEIDDLKNTGLILDRQVFKERVTEMIKNYIKETEHTRDLFIKEYQFQINQFHANFAATKFRFDGAEDLVSILIKKFVSEEENIIANNKLLFMQSLQDRIMSLDTLVGDCTCGCKPPKNQKKDFQLREIKFVINNINVYLTDQINVIRKDIRAAIKSCNVYNKSYSEMLNKLLSFHKITKSRSEIETIINEWVDLSEVQRIKFNMKQEYVSLQVLPDEMSNLIKNIRVEIRSFHQKLINDPTEESPEVYEEKLKKLNSNLIDIRDLVNDNILSICNLINLKSILNKKMSQLTEVEKRIAYIVQEIILLPSVLVLEEPFTYLNKQDKSILADWLKTINKKLKIMIIFSCRSQKDSALLADEICIIENETVVQQGKIKEVTTKPISLTFLKEINDNHLNVFHGDWYQSDLAFYNTKIGRFENLEQAPIMAVRSDDLLFTIKKPRFNLFYKVITIPGIIKSINKVNNEYSYICFETNNRQLFEVKANNSEQIKVKTKGWIILSKNIIYIFDSKDQHLIGTR